MELSIALFMFIPESDHLMVSNLIAFAALVIAAISVIYALIVSRKSKRVADEAMRLSRGANKRADETLLILKSQPWMKNLPDVSMDIQVGKISRISAETDIITLHFINESQGIIVINRVFIGAPFKTQIDSPVTLNYLEELKVRVYIDEQVPCSLLPHPRASSENIEALRQLVEDELVNAPVTIQMVNEFRHHYDIDYNYSVQNTRFEGIPLPVSYRASKVGDK